MVIWCVPLIITYKGSGADNGLLMFSHDLSRICSSIDLYDLKYALSNIGFDGEDTLPIVNKDDMWW